MKKFAMLLMLFSFSVVAVGCTKPASKDAKDKQSDADKAKEKAKDKQADADKEKEKAGDKQKEADKAKVKAVDDAVEVKDSVDKAVDKASKDIKDAAKDPVKDDEK